jgi:hypothetical protein
MNGVASLVNVAGIRVTFSYTFEPEHMYIHVMHSDIANMYMKYDDLDVCTSSSSVFGCCGKSKLLSVFSFKLLYFGNSNTSDLDSGSALGSDVPCVFLFLFLGDRTCVTPI